MLSWTSGLQCRQPTDSSYITIQNIAILASSTIISPAVAFCSYCRYGTVNGMILSRNWLFRIFMLFHHFAERMVQ